MLKLLKYLFKRWYLVIIIMAAIIGQVYLQLMLPEYMGEIMKIISSSLAGVGDTTSQIWEVGIKMIGVSAGVLGLALIQALLNSHVSAQVAKDLRHDVFAKVNSISLSDYRKFGTATLITRTTSDVEQIKDFLFTATRILVMSPTYMIIALIKIVNLDISELGYVVGFAIPLILLLIVILVILVMPMFKIMRTKIDNITTVLRENLTGIRVIRAYNQQRTQYTKFNDANISMRNLIKKSGRYMAVANPYMSIVFNFAYLGIYALGFVLLSGLNASAAGSLAPGGTFIPGTDFVRITDLLANTQVAAQYSMQIMQSFLMLTFVMIMIPQAIVSVKRINEILDLPDATSADEGAFDQESFDNSELKATIEFKDVTFTYPDASVPTLCNISFKTSPGTTTAIIGSTGSGKSSIINLIPRFFDATEGQILFNNTDIKNIPSNVVRDNIGFVPQQAVLFRGTIKENMLYGKADATEEEINNALNVAQAEHFIQKLPKGLDTFVSQSGKNFSGGQRQRLCIARALVRKPQVYIFDDSFSALDFKTDVKLRSALKNYTDDAAIIVVAQRVSSILDADNIIVLDKGSIVGQGKHSDLLLNCPTYVEIVRSQLDAEEVDKTIKMQQAALKEGN